MEDKFKEINGKASDEAEMEKRTKIKDLEYIIIITI